MDWRLVGVMVLAMLWVKIWRTPARPRKIDLGMENDEDDGWGAFRRLAAAPTVRRNPRDRVWRLPGSRSMALAL